MKQLIDQALAGLRSKRAEHRAKTQADLAALESEAAQAENVLKRLGELHENLETAKRDIGQRRTNIDRLFTDDALQNAINKAGQYLAQGGAYQEALSEIAQIHFYREHKEAILEAAQFFSTGHIEREIATLKQQNAELLRRHSLL